MIARNRYRVVAAFRLCFIASLFFGQWVAGAETDEQGRVISTEGKVEFSPQGVAWTAAVSGQKLVATDRLRTLALSRAMAQLTELGRVRLDELTTLEILPPRNAKSKGTLDLKAGAMYFFTRDRPREFEIQTPQALAASRGTEFLVSIAASGREIFTIFDGEAEITNALGSVTIRRGEQGIVDPGQPPRKTAVIESSRIVQWWLYYAAIVDPAELSFTQTQQQALGPALDLYQQGDLLRALEAFPQNRDPENDAERIFRAALLLSVGQAARAEPLLASTNSVLPAANALKLMIDAVESRAAIPLAQPRTATEWLANSYALQASYKLPESLAAARKAVELSTNFGFGWERVAEIEFSFGHRAAASLALDQALKFSPHNPQAWALKGFLLSAQSRWREADEAFQKAVALDPALGNGWLGRGLVRIRLGDDIGGREDLQTAAAMEPNRSLLRSYLGKAFDNTYDDGNTERELNLAKQLDGKDPTPWLYSALLLRQELRYNEAIEDLEKSSDLNDNRQVYRSRMLLDEDRAVRSASLATMYRDAGMDEVSLREAARAVDSDYANYSAHQFLAESFDAMRDPTRFNLRAETPWFNELLLANLLSPVGGGNLSQNISQEEYSRMFEANNFGFNSDAEYRSDGQVHELASQFGTQGKFSYALDLDYQHNDGVRPNNSLSRIEWYTRMKYELTPQDSVFLLIKYEDYNSGDNFQYYNPNATTTNLAPFGIPTSPVIRTNFSFSETEKPIVLAGFHHEWAPGIHTLLLGGHLTDDQHLSDTDTEQTILERVAGNPTEVFNQLFDVNYRTVFDAYTAEASQIIQTDRHLTIFGGRYQTGQFETTDLLTLSLPSPALSAYFNNPPAQDDVVAEFERVSVYGYHTWEIIPHVHITGGLVYDRLTYPNNFRLPPVEPGSTTREKWSPKAALVWSPISEFTLRGVYTRSLGGVSFDESIRLEPSELAGFSQAFRTLIPESVVGSVSAPEFETAGVAIDLKFPTKTYVGLDAELVKSIVNSDVGVFDYNGTTPPPPAMSVSSTPQRLEYTEPSASLTVNQLVSDWWSFGAQYRFTRSRLHTQFPEILPTVDAGADTTEQADLQQATFFAMLNHPSGFYARFETLWYHQDNFGYATPLPGDDFFQHNFLVGYRLRRQLAELTVGVLNIGGTDYQLNPLNTYTELPRSRVFVARCKVNF